MPETPKDVNGVNDILTLADKIASSPGLSSHANSFEALSSSISLKQMVMKTGIDL